MKPDTRIDELLLLVRILTYNRMGEPAATAEVLMNFKSEFAPSLLRIDTLRMWLKRHRGRTVKVVNDYRPYQYELNRQGKKRILFLLKRLTHTQEFREDIGLHVQILDILSRIRDHSDPYFRTHEAQMIILDIYASLARINPTFRQ